MTKQLYKNIRKNALPTPFCPGCGHGIVMGLVSKAIDELDIDIDEFVFVSGPGCAGWIPEHFAADNMHTGSGQAISHAIGIKKASPNLRVVVIGGDGDLGSSGGNSLIHAAKKNLDITVICSNNLILAQSGGQVSPTTPIGAITTTSRTGNTERPFDLCKIVYGAGAQYIARSSAYHAKMSLKYIKYGLVAKGFSFIEILSPCPVEYGKRNNFKNTVDMLRSLRLNCVPGDITTASERIGIADRSFIGEYVRK